MPYFVLSCVDNEGVLEKRLKNRPEHIKRLEKLNQEGRLVTAGALPKDPDDTSLGFHGSIMIVNFDCKEDLDTWLNEEPFIREGIYSHVDVKVFNKAFPIM